MLVPHLALGRRSGLYKKSWLLLHARNPGESHFSNASPPNAKQPEDFRPGLLKAIAMPVKIDEDSIVVLRPNSGSDRA